MTYRIAFFLAQDVRLSMDDLNDILAIRGERTLKILDDETWAHKVYDSTVMWKHDIDTNIFTASISGGKAERTCGSLVEWMLRYASEYLDDADRDLKGISVFA